MAHKLMKAGLVSFALIAGAGLAACDDGAEEEKTMGETMEDMGKKMEEAAEDAGQAMEEAADEAGDAAEEAGEEMKEQMDGAQ